MLKNYLVTTYRNLLRNKIFTYINIIGLSVGVGSVLLIALFLQHELSYDNFFKDSQRIYRLSLHRIYPDRERYFASSAVMMANVLKQQFDEVEESTRLHRLFFQPELEVRVEDNTYMESRFYFADSSFFKVFSHNFLFGNADKSLNGPNKVVLTASTAKKYFGTENALDKTLVLDSLTMTVSGVIQDIPSNSHIHFDLLSSLNQIPYIQEAIDDNAWVNPWLYTYVKLKDGVPPNQLESHFDEMVNAYGKASIAQALGANYQEEGHRFRYFLQPLESIHLNSNLDVEVEPNGSYSYLVMLGAIALIILLISVINFVNLATAKSSERAKEVGIRKVMGSNRRYLITQFIVESIVLILVSSLTAFVMVVILMPLFNQILGVPIRISTLLEPWYLFSFIVFIILMGILSGMYPAIFISAQKPVETLKGSYKGNVQGIWLRNSLILVQFFVSVVMISGAVGIHKQMDYLKSKDLGFNKENVLVVRNNEPNGANSEAFCLQIKQLSEVVSVGSAFAMPGGFLGSNVVAIADRPDLNDIRVNSVFMDDYFMQTLEFELVEGRGFDQDFNDSLNVIVNETFVKNLALKNPIGVRITNIGGTLPDGTTPEVTIIGIVRDYNFLSLHSEITPLIISNPPNNYRMPVLAVRINSNNLQETISKLQTSWNKYSSEKFQYSFLDQNLEKQYQSEFTSAKMFDGFTLIAIIISCVGLFGMTTYIVQLRMKEMSIRKVLGVGSWGIVVLFSKKFFYMIILSFLMAVPVTILLLKYWLDGFAYHISISLELFLLSAGLIFFFVILTMSYQVMKLIMVNPVEALRRE